MRRVPILLVFVCAPLVASAGEKPRIMQPGPKSPAESLKCIQTRPGFTVELMAAEPLVQDPIAFAWGPDGKFWVVEMGDYPLGSDGKGKHGGRVKFLEKTKGGAAYDKATVFLDNLGYPTGVLPWGKGVLVTCTPDIFYAEDTDGDGKADKKVVLYTGFAEGNQQHRVNGLVWGLDNWLYGANGDSGGRIKSLKTGQTVDINGRDFRIKPDLGLIEAATGQTQYGRGKDDWGSWFGNNNSNPLFHFVLEDHYLRRNPFLAPPDLRVQVSVRPGASPVFPISKPLVRFNSPQSVNHFTSACSAILYRDDLFGPEFAGNSFVSEPVHNLVHREIVSANLVTFKSQRAEDEQTSEFLASSDNWFRPTMIQVGPDGCLWIADMYRFVIEHPQWIPKDWQDKLDLRAGHDLGRIYRVYPKDKKPRALVPLDTLAPNKLATALASPNGWTRDHAQALLIEKKDLPVDDNLRKMLQNGLNPLARLHALCTLDGRQTLTPAMIRGALQDKHTGVRRQAVRLCEPWLDKDADLGPALLQLLDDADPLVQLQLSCSLGAWQDARAAEGLSRLVWKNARDRFLLTATLSSLGPKTWEPMLKHLLAQARKQPLPEELVSPLLRLANGFNNPRSTALLVGAILIPGKKQDPASHFQTVVNLLDVLDQTNTPLANLWKEADADLKSALADLRLVFVAARAILADAKASPRDRLLAIRLVGRGLDNQGNDLKLLAGLLNPRSSDDVQSAVIATLGQQRYAPVADILLSAWKTLAPTHRAQAADVLLSRKDLTGSLLDALEQKKILPLEIDAVRRQRLLQHKDAQLRQRAEKVLAQAVSPDRAKVIDSYRAVLTAQGSAEQGAKVFAKVCANCHKLGGLGQQVGPDLASVGDKSAEGLLIAILDPNRAVEARYVNYTAVTVAGLSVSGLLQGETSTSITLVGADGKSKTLLRRDLEELFSSGKSVMPEGLEKEVPLADMANLLAFLQNNLPKLKSKSFPGNQPTLVKAGSDGSMTLSPKQAAIFGTTLVLEEKYGNLGYWSSADDHAVWTVDVPRKGTYAVWLTLACPDDSAGNQCSVRIGNQEVLHKVAGTGSWDKYQRVHIGDLMLEAGRHEARMSSQGPLRGSLFDLKEIQLIPK